jgi:purine-binding chemotaxis protein CheW
MASTDTSMTSTDTSATRSNSAQTNRSSATVNQFFTFLLGEDIYGMDILNIKEIIEYGGITRVPMMPAFIAGVINLRGSVVPVIDLARRFSKEPSQISKKTSIVILEVEEKNQSLEIGVIVDVVNEVLDIARSEIEPSPLFGTKIHTDFIGGIGKVDGKLLTLLDVDVVLSIDQLSVNVTQ